MCTSSPRVPSSGLSSGPGLACLLAAALLAGAGCQDERHPLAIHLDFGGSAADGAPAGTAWPCPGSCGEIPMTCDTWLSIRVVDAVDPNAPESVHASKCLKVDGSEMGNLCALGNLDIPLDALPLDRARIEIALWDASQFSEQQCPDESIFDLQGLPLATVAPQPAVAGAAYFDIGSAPEVHVPLSCFDIAPLDRLECLPPPPPPKLEVQVRDLEQNRMLGPGEEAEGLIVEHAVVAQSPSGDWVTTQDRTHEMTLAPLGEHARWTGTLDAALDQGQELCVQVTDRSASLPIPVLTCFDIDADDVKDGELQLEALHIPRSVIDAVLQAGGQLDLPQTGLVIGRVTPVDGETTAVDGLTVITTVAPVAPWPGASTGPITGLAAEVAYLSEDRTTIEGVMTTTSNGYFVATGVPYPSVWLASDPEGIRGGQSLYRGGLIQDVVNAVRIEAGPTPDR